MWLSYGRGLRPESERYEANPSERAQKLLYYVKSVGRFLCEQNYITERSDSVGAVLIYIVRGKLRVETGGAEEQMAEGEFIFLNHRHDCRIKIQQEAELLWIYMDGGNISEFCDEINSEYGNIIRHDHAEIISGYMKNILTLFQYKGKIEEVHQSKMIYELLCSMLHTGGENEGEIHLVSNDPQVDSIKKYFREHMNEEISAEELAKKFHLSISQLNRKFRDHTGQSPHEYLTNIRINRAKVLLRDSQMTIAEIAGEVGYAYDTSLAAAFRRKMGMSPREFRNMSI